MTTSTMTLEMDPDLKAVLQFMQASVPAAKLVGVAREMAIAAPLLWGRYNAEPVIAMALVAAPISGDCPQSLSDATE